MFATRFSHPAICIERRKRQIRRLSTFLATQLSQAFVKPTMRGEWSKGGWSAVKRQKESLHTLIHAMTPQSTVQQRCQSASHPVRQSEGLPHPSISHTPPLPCPSPRLSVSQSNKQLAKKACRWASQIAQAMLQHKRWLRFTLAQAITHHLPRKCVCLCVCVCVRVWVCVCVTQKLAIGSNDGLLPLPQAHRMGETKQMFLSIFCQEWPCLLVVPSWGAFLGCLLGLLWFSGQVPLGC